MLNLRRAGLDGSPPSRSSGVDYLALPQLVGDRQTIQFAYIDGWHTFDYTLLDFFYVDKMLDPGGVVAFNDCALPSVRRVIELRHGAPPLSRSRRRAEATVRQS